MTNPDGFSSAMSLSYNKPLSYSIVQEPSSFLTQSVSCSQPPSSLSAISSVTSVDPSPAVSNSLSYSLNRPVVAPPSYSSTSTSSSSFSATVIGNCPSVLSSKSHQETVPLPPIQPPFPYLVSNSNSLSKSSLSIPPPPPPPSSLSSSGIQRSNINPPSQSHRFPPPPSSSSFPRPPHALTNSRIPLPPPPPPKSLSNTRSFSGSSRSTPALPFPLSQSSNTNNAPNIHPSLSQSSYSHRIDQSSLPNQSISCVSSDITSIPSIQSSLPVPISHPMPAPRVESFGDRNSSLPYPTSHIPANSKEIPYPIQMQGPLPPISHPYQSTGYEISQSLSSVSSSSISNSIGNNSSIYSVDKPFSGIHDLSSSNHSTYDHVPNLTHPLSGY